MNVNAISNVNTAFNAGFTTTQNKVTNPFMMRNGNGVDTIELSTKKEAPKSKFELAGEAFKKGFTDAAKSVKGGLETGFDKAATEAEKKETPLECYTTSNVPVMTAFYDEAFKGIGNAFVNVAKGIIEAVKVLTQPAQ